MLLFKRLATALVLLVILDSIVSIGALVVGGCIVGTGSAMQTPKSSGRFNDYEVGRQVGEQSWPQYGPPLLLASLGVAVVGAVGLSFSGVLPWCRRASAPPPLPVGLG